MRPRAELKKNLALSAQIPNFTHFHPENPEAQPKNLAARRIIIHPQTESSRQGVTKICRLSWLTNGALVYEPKCAGGGGCGVSANEYISAH
jgi:hypothetical protein